jgi:predicted DsbA family dithiol-disulfide isomerase
MNLIIYGDFNCPYSCLASVHADTLIERGTAAVEWRAVEHDPTIPTPSRPVSGAVASMLDGELEEIRGLLRDNDTFPIRRPPIQPNSRRAIEAFAGTASDEAHELRRRLFAALWFDGRDIGDGAVIAELAGDVPTTPSERAATWQEAWSSLERRVVPTLVLPDGYVSRGLGALTRLARLAA